MTAPATDEQLVSYERTANAHRGLSQEAALCLIARIKAEEKRIAELERMIDLSDDGGVIQALLSEIEKKDAALARIAELQSTIASNNYLTRARIDLEHDNVTLWKERAEAALAKDALGAELIEWVANPGLYSKVYPQMCFFCGAKFPDEYEAHADGCLHIRARALLREVTK